LKKYHYNFLLLLSFILISCSSFAQEAIPENINDSLVPEPEKSSLQTGVSFSSRAISSGRDFGVQQNVMVPSVFYYHKSGFHIGAEGNILSETSPKYNLTTISAGYGDSITGKWNYDIGYSRNIFNPDTAGLIQNSLDASLSFLLNHFTASLQYSYLFGDEKAHRLTAGANAYCEASLIGLKN
jgi:hypothetical protein